MRELRKGDRVELTEEGLREGLQGRNQRRTGVVVGRSSKDHACIRVLRDGLKSVEVFHESFWRKLEDSPPL